MAATHAHFRPSMRCSFESMLCFGVADPRTAVIIEVVLKYKRWIFLRNRRGHIVDFYETNSDSYACFDSPRLLYSDLRDQIRLWLPELSPFLCTKLSLRIFVYTLRVALANASHRLNDNGGANKITAFVEIEEPELQPTDDDQVQDSMGVRADFDDDGIVLYSDNNVEDHEDDDDGDDDDDDDDDDEDDDDGELSKPPRGLSWGEIKGLKQERFKSGAEEESLVCSICLEEFSAGVKITPLSCSHTFHHNCIASWLQKQASCPLCRCDITQEC